MNRILVIGGTGNIGRTVVTQLTAAGADVRAMVRNPDTAGLPPGVEVSAASPALTCITKHARRIVYMSRRSLAYSARECAPGREYIAAYVTYIHYVEGMYEAAMSPASGHYPEGPPVPHKEKRHGVRAV